MSEFDAILQADAADDFDDVIESVNNPGQSLRLRQHYDEVFDVPSLELTVSEAEGGSMPLFGEEPLFRRLGYTASILLDEDAVRKLVETMQKWLEA